MTNESHLGHLRRKLRADEGEAEHLSRIFQAKQYSTPLLELMWTVGGTAMQVPLRQKAFSDLPEFLFHLCSIGRPSLINLGFQMYPK